MRGGGAGHAAYHRVQRDQVLERDLAQDHSLRLGRHALLDFDGGVQTGGPAAVKSDPALKFVHHLDGAILHDVVDVAAQQGVSVQRLLDGPVNRQTAIVEKVPASDGDFDGVDSGVGQSGVVASRIDGEVLAGTEAAHDLVGDVGKAAVARFASGNHERNARLVDKDGVGLVDDGGVELAVDLLIGPHGDAVAEEVEADLVLGGISDIGGVGGPPLGGRHPLLDVRDREAEEAVDAAHPRGVPAGKVVIDGHHVDAAMLAREPRDRRHGRQRFALPGLHLGDRAARQRERPAQLDVVHVLAEDSAGGGRSERDPTGQIFGFRSGGAQLGVAQTRKGGPHRMDALDGRPVAVEYRAQKTHYRKTTHRTNLHRRTK